MTVQFIFMTIAFVIMLIVAIIQNSKIKRLDKTNEELCNRLEKTNEELRKNRYREYMGFGKSYRRHYKYIIIKDHADNTLNYFGDKYQNDGYNYDREKSTDRLLVFVKTEEVKPKEE